jgi:hypothetical protein
MRFHDIPPSEQSESCPSATLEGASPAGPFESLADLAIVETNLSRLTSQESVLERKSGESCKEAVFVPFRIT